MILFRRRFGACAGLLFTGLLWPDVVLAGNVDFKLNPIVVNGTTPPKLLNKALLHYPDAMLGTGVHATVVLKIQVNELGEVSSVSVTSGTKAFHSSSLAAGKSLRFSPAKKNNQPVSSTVTATIHFAPASHSVKDDSMLVMVVEEEAAPNEEVRSVTTIEAKTLDRKAGQTFAEGVSSAAGVVVAKTASTAAKPIIRGHQERRLLILNDGIRHEGQKWGVDHGTEIDPFSAGRINVVRGASAARYGPDAIGGVLLISPPPMRTEPGWGGKWLSSFSTNGLQPYAALRLDTASDSGWSYRVEGNLNGNASMTTPDYILGNTATRVANVSTILQKTWDSGQIRWRYSRHMFKGGVFYGVKHGTPDEFQAELNVEIPTASYLWEINYDIDRPFQEVAHDTLSQHLHTFGQWGVFNAIYSFQHNWRQEFEEARESITGPQYDFTLRTHSIDLNYLQPRLSLQSLHFDGGFGFQGALQENIYRGFHLLPNYRSFSGGLFAFERMSLPNGDIEIAGRLDGLTRTAYISEMDRMRMMRFDAIKEEQCELLPTTYECPSQFLTDSLSLGFLYHAIPDVWDIKLDLSKASRFPNLDEMYMLGSAPTLPVFAVGDSGLGVETAWGASLATGIRLPAIEAEISAHGMSVDNYIAFIPEISPNGGPVFNVTIQGALPLYRFQATQAHIYGVDGYFTLGPKSQFGLDVRGAAVIGQNADTGSFIPGIPADHVTGTALWRPKINPTFSDTEFGVSVKYVSKARTDDSVDFAPAPLPYFLLGARMESQFKIGKSTFNAGVVLDNALNVTYRDYSSLLRYFASQPGRNIRFYTTQTF